MARADPFDLGVTESRLAEELMPQDANRPAYVSRTVDDEILASLARRRRVVLVVGPSKSGKTRTAFETTHYAFPKHLILAPKRQDAEGAAVLPQLLSASFPLPRVGRKYVLWLDELAFYLSSGQITYDAVDSWLHTHPGSVAIATIGLENYRRLQPLEAASTEDASRMLEGCEVAFLDPELDENERQRAAASYDLGPEELKHLPEHLVAAGALVMRWKEARSSGSPAAAILQAAVQWRRVGLPDAVPVEFLRLAFPLFDPHTISEDEFAAALEWASRPIGVAFGLLTPDVSAAGSVFAVSDVLVQRIDASASDPLDTRVIRCLRTFLSTDAAGLLLLAAALAMSSAV